MTFEILGTGSAGNCFLIDDAILIDAGLPYSKIKDKIIGVKYVLLTHIHGDHFNTTTIRKMAVDIEPIFICGGWMQLDVKNIVDEIFVDVVPNNNKVFYLDGYEVAMVEAYHDVPNCGWRIMDKHGHRHFHITDTSTMEGISAKGYDTASIECNHERERALDIIAEAEDSGEFTHLYRAMNSHLSVDKTISFCKQNKIKKLFPVHIGNSTKKEVLSALKMW